MADGEARETAAVGAERSAEVLLHVHTHMRTYTHMHGHSAQAEDSEASYKEREAQEVLRKLRQPGAVLPGEYRIKADLKSSQADVKTQAHARTHARTHACTHAHTHIGGRRATSGAKGAYRRGR